MDTNTAPCTPNKGATSFEVDNAIYSPNMTTSTDIKDFIFTPDATTPTKTDPRSALTGSVYRPWDELDDDAKITTSAAAKEVRHNRYTRDLDYRGPDVAAWLDIQADRLAGEIYDAMVSVEDALNDHSSAGMVYLTAPFKNLEQDPYIPTKSVVALAYWIVKLICDGYKYGFRIVLSPHANPPQQRKYLNWKQRKTALLNVLKTNKHSVELIFGLSKPDILSLIHSPEVWNEANPAKFPEGQTPQKNKPGAPYQMYNFFAQLRDSQKPRSVEEAKMLRREMRGRNPTNPEASYSTFVGRELERAAWVKKAYKKFVSTEERPDRLSQRIAIFFFWARRVWDEKHIIAALWKVADLVQDGALRGFIQMPQFPGIECGELYWLDEDTTFENKLKIMQNHLKKDKYACVQIMERGWCSMAEFVESPRAVFRMRRMSHQRKGDIPFEFESPKGWIASHFATASPEERTATPEERTATPPDRFATPPDREMKQSGRHGNNKRESYDSGVDADRDEDCEILTRKLPNRFKRDQHPGDDSSGSETPWSPSKKPKLSMTQL